MHRQSHGPKPPRQRERETTEQKDEPNTKTNKQKRQQTDGRAETRQAESRLKDGRDKSKCVAYCRGKLHDTLKLSISLRPPHSTFPPPSPPPALSAYFGSLVETRTKDDVCHHSPSRTRCSDPRTAALLSPECTPSSTK